VRIARDDEIEMPIRKPSIERAQGSSTRKAKKRNPSPPQNSNIMQLVGSPRVHNPRRVDKVELESALNSLRSAALMLPVIADSKRKRYIPGEF
jgi:hypothetical protein